MSSIRAHFSPTPPSELLHDKDQNQPAESEHNTSIADVSLLAAELTELIMNKHATGYGHESEEGGSMSIKSECDISIVNVSAKFSSSHATGRVTSCVIVEYESSLP